LQRLLRGRARSPEAVMDEKITLTFDEKNRYQLAFSPREFWLIFSQSYSSLPWAKGPDGLLVVAENYTYLVDLLVQARMFYLSTKPADERYK